MGWGRLQAMGRLWGGRWLQGWAGLLDRDRLLGGDRFLGVGDGLWEDEAGVLPLLGEGGFRDGAK